MRDYHVYILASKSRRLYIGVTNDIIRRLLAHRDGSVTHTARYRINRLVYLETTSDVRAAIAREKELKGWRREKKVSLIVADNPTWDDLMPDWRVVPSLGGDLLCAYAKADPSLRSG